jgi:uncharacterized protein (TIGR03546 family)
VLLPKPIRKLIAVFRGEVSPTLILLSAGLGLWFGLMPSWTGMHVLLLVLALVLSTNVGIFILFAGFGRALAYALAPVLYHVGVWAQEALAPLFAWIGGLPILGLTDFATYAVAGGFVLGPIAGLVVGLGLGRLVTVFRKTWLKLEDNSAAFKQWQNKSWVRWLDWFLLGKRTKDVRTVLQRKPRLIRIPGVIVAVLLVLGFGAGIYFAGGDQLKGYAESALTAANGAQVDIATFDFQPGAGRVMATGLAITDPKQPAQNRLVVADLGADASLWSLLRGEIVMDELRLGGIARNQPRETPGVVLERDAETAAADEPQKKSALPFDPSRFNLPAEDIARLETYFKRAQQIRDVFEQVQQYLPDSEPEPPAPQKPQSYLEHLIARAPVPPSPRFVVRKVVLPGVQFEAEQIGVADVTIENLSDAPRAAGLPVAVEIVSKDQPTRLRIVSHYEDPSQGAELSGEFKDVDLRQLQTSLSTDNPFVLEGGKATTSVDGRLSRTEVDITLNVQTQNMKLGTSGKPVFSLDPRVTGEVAKVLENIDTTLRLVGPTGSPRLVFDKKALEESFKTALVDAGKAQLAAQLDKHLGDKIPGGVPDLDKVKDDPVGKGKELLGGLLGGKKKNDDE